MTVPKLIVEGWRFLAHSYAIVNQWQCLSLLRRSDVTLAIRDLPYYMAHWPQVHGLFPAEADAALKALPMAAEGEEGDATLRLSFPLDYTLAGERTWVFGTSELKDIAPNAVKGGLDMLRQCQAGVITPSQWSKQGFMIAGIEERRIAVIPHGADPVIFRPDDALREEARQRFNLTGFTFISVGAMITNKGMDLLLKAFAAVLERYPDCQLILKGNDALYPSKDFLSRTFATLPAGAQSKVLARLIYMGGTVSMADMATLYRSADAYVSPYRAEGFNMPVLEAASCGLPIICTAGGSTDDFTDPSFTLHVSAQPVQMSYEDRVVSMLEPDLEHLTAQMIRAIEDEAWRRQAHEASAAFVRAGFTWDHVADMLMKTVFLRPGEPLAL